MTDRDDAATLARLRERATPEQPGVCPFCGGAPMLADGHDDGGWARWRCPRCGKAYMAPGGDGEIAALLSAYDALATEATRLRAAVAGYVAARLMGADPLGGLRAALATAKKGTDDAAE